METTPAFPPMMRNPIKKTALLALSALCFVGVNAQKTVRFDIRNSQARVLDVSPSTYIKPVIAELKVDTSKGRIRETWPLTPEELAARTIENDGQATLQNLRTYAVYKSSEKNNCDVIIAATFDIQITEKGATITIVGYPANFTNWATGTVADYDWILNEPRQLLPQSTSVEGEKPKNKK